MSVLLDNVDVDFLLPEEKAQNQSEMSLIVPCDWISDSHNVRFDWSE